MAYFRDAAASSPTKVRSHIEAYRELPPTPQKTVNSLLTVETNASHQITRHTEEWDHKRETTSEDGFLGMLNEQRKKLTANVTGMFVGQDPPPKA